MSFSQKSAFKRIIKEKKIKDEQPQKNKPPFIIKAYMLCEYSNEEIVMIRKIFKIFDRNVPLLLIIY